MAGIRALQRRVKRIESARKPRPSPIIILFNSFEAFADAAYADVEAGRVAGEFLPILDILRDWEAGGVWMLAYAR
ncbi:hypothetical protein Q9Q95_09880 [Sphingomonas sp. DG1-23]|uniref:hypothetical protein n=1 Tax=Sphingomonas sp. DG1-23 TaxID=3068316 RepID=UPI00273F9000|nr:hypothetical protein [Sphingomonas sp. DG1-23]MDP5279230.1 hypothetical protein [Sphingomonas sp. DG1-23]